MTSPRSSACSEGIARSAPDRSPTRWSHGTAFFDIPHVGCAADITCDGATNAGDFTVFASNFGQGPGATHNLGDLNGDGLVNATDFVILAGAFGCGP